MEMIDYGEPTGSPTATTAYMFGIVDFQNGPCAMDYDPWVHAEILDLPIIFRDDLPDDEMVACYSPDHEAVFVRPNLHGVVERCAIAHEIVHFEHGDIGANDIQEERADASQPAASSARHASTSSSTSPKTPASSRSSSASQRRSCARTCA
ncbi:hypothetical protein [Microbacterium sp. GXF0217]